MNRKIQFRGFNLKNKQWIYGYYLVNRGKHYIVQDEVVEPFKEASDFEVDAESVGQWAGIADGVELYEGDYVDRITKDYYKGELFGTHRLKFQLRYEPDTYQVMLVCIDERYRGDDNRGWIRTVRNAHYEQIFELKGNEYEQKLKEQHEDTETRS